MKIDKTKSSQPEVLKRKLIKFGNYSLCITLPKQLISKVNLKKGEEIELTVDAEKQRLIIDLSKSRKAKTKPKHDSRW